MSQWFDEVVLANSESLTAGTAVEKGIDRLKSPTVCVALEDLEGAADDTVTIEIVGDVGTYEIDQRTLSGTGSYTVDIPQAYQVRLTSTNGVTYSAEVRGNPQ